MLQNYFKIAVRNIWKHRLFSFINIFGLASGLMVCFLAIAHIKGALDYDHFHPKGERIYRIITDVISNENDKTAFATTPLPLAETLKKDYGSVENAARVVRTYAEVQGNDKRLDFLTFAVDVSFFQMFGYPVLKGQFPAAPGTAVISQATAEKIFGTQDPVGQVLEQEGIAPSVITAVVPDTAFRSHLKFDILFALPADKMGLFDEGKGWNDFGKSYTYILLKEGIAEGQLEETLPSVGKRESANLAPGSVKSLDFRAQPLTDISPAMEELMNSTYEPQISGLMLEMAVGLVTLLMAAFNYINLTLARSMSRAREVGIRKTSGALRWQLLGQFMAESVILSLLALMLAYMMLELVKPMAFVQQWLIGGVVWDWKLWAAFITFSIAAGLLAGMIPAKVLSNFQPAEVLRSRNGLKVIRGISLRKTLIVLQFSISLLAMIALVTMMRQQYYMATGDYGFRTKNVLNIPLNSISYERLSNEVSKLAGVEHVSGISEPFGHHGATERIKMKRGDEQTIPSFICDVAPDFTKTLQLTLVSGQDLSKKSASGRHILINEEAVKKFNLLDNRSAIGKSIWLNDSTEVQIAGVVKDFRFTSFNWQIRPLIIRPQMSSLRYMHVAVTPGSKDRVLEETKRIFKQLKPYETFEGKWFDDFLYERHAHMDDISFMALLLGISFSIACLGLLGMVTYNTQTRIKEVGVRKVMGAEVAQIIWLLSRDFVKLLTIAGAIALPLGYLAGYAFLFNFAYHVSIGFETLGLCFGVLLLLGGLIISTRTYKAATGNPVEALGNE
ncbi:ABC transporter permease [Dyadobacter chenhuakuii]|uniref:ABC transporter permease n=1 Tax=Dyadobacter chenhuakuii TaxID=2909339 RepID=A0ABY4XPK1_9BACT|nr:ABC transporter permease [Dyadobacter chenhuakuii]MCF2494469.1 ABC transporter permease [Dyadobacter chenhuakuii]USJ32206.1 ABC transporter permease [Dyadobacter chenhuakuii]